MARVPRNFVADNTRRIKVNYEYPLGAHEFSVRFNETVPLNTAVLALESFIDSAIRPKAGVQWTTTRISTAAKGSTKFTQYPHMPIQGSSGLEYNSQDYPVWLAWSPITTSVAGSRFSFNIFGLLPIINRRMRINSTIYSGAHASFIADLNDLRESGLVAIDGLELSSFNYVNLIADDDVLDQARGK